MKEATTAMCKSVEGDYFHEYINAKVAAAKENGQGNAIIQIWQGRKPELYVLLMRSKGFHVEHWEVTEYSPERLFIGW